MDANTSLLRYRDDEDLEGTEEEGEYRPKSPSLYDERPSRRCFQRLEWRKCLGWLGSKIRLIVASVIILALCGSLVLAL